MRKLCFVESHIVETRGGAYFTINSYGGVRSKGFCYDPIPEIWSDIDTQSQDVCQILIPKSQKFEELTKTI